MGLIAHIIEAKNIPTLVIGTAYDIMSRVRSPRAVFVDHPVGRTFGLPRDRARSEAILERALGELAHFQQPDEIRDPGFQWSADGSREWENQLRAEMRADR